MKNLFRSIDLQLFSDGGGEGTAAGSANDAGENTSPSTQGISGDNGENIAQEDANNTAAAAEPENEGGESYEELIRGRFKEDHDKDVGQIIKRRLAPLRQENNSLRDIVETLMARANVSNIDDFRRVINSKEEISNAAAREGCEDEVYKEVEAFRKHKIRQAEEERIRKEQEEQEERLKQAIRRAQEQENIWREQAKEVQEVYPEFNLKEQLQNPDFRALVMAKNPQYQISMKDAYRIVNADKIAQNIEKAAYEKFSKSVSTRAQRPPENGSGTTARAEIKSVSSLTKKERADLALRAQRGERITF